MKLNRIVALLLALVMLLACSAMAEDATQETTITDMIGREVTIVPGSYPRVVCIGRSGYDTTCGMKRAMRAMSSRYSSSPAARYSFSSAPPPAVHRPGAECLFCTLAHTLPAERMSIFPNRLDGGNA